MSSFRAPCAVFALLLMSPVAWAGGPEKVTPPERSVAAISSLRTGLGRALRGALEDGPEAAIDVCRHEAPRLSADVGEGLRIGRTSHRLRNPRNAPEPWMLPLLEAFRSGALPPGAPHSVDLGARGIATVVPITMQPLCTTCHGDAVDPALRARILERYPEDDAVGFAVGEFRGMFWAVEAP